MEKKFFYIDENGVKHNYVGKVIANKDGSFNGFLTRMTCIEKEVELTHHQGVSPVVGYSSYFTYVNADGDVVNYYSFVKENEDGTKYFTYSTSKDIELTLHPATTKRDVFYTYMNNGKETPWTKTPVFIKGAYYGVL